MSVAFRKEKQMKRIIFVLLIVAVASIATGALATNKTSISNNVDTIVAMLERGKDATVFKADTFSPYAFIMESNGKMLVHPTLTGESLKEKALPVYTALMQANSEGVWVKYEWEGKLKHTYVKKTKSNLIVGSGY